MRILVNPHYPHICFEGFPPRTDDVAQYFNNDSMSDVPISSRESQPSLPATDLSDFVDNVVHDIEDIVLPDGSRVCGSCHVKEQMEKALHDDNLAEALVLDSRIRHFLELNPSMAEYFLWWDPEKGISAAIRDHQSSLTKK